MALKALTVSAVFSYVSDLDSAKKRVQVPVDPADPSKGMKEDIQIAEGATKFLLKPLDVYLMAHIYDRASVLSRNAAESASSNDVSIHTRVNQTNIDAVRFGLTGFENFTDASGSNVALKTVTDNINGREYKAVDADIMNMLGLQLIAELSEQIKQASQVSKADAKN